MTQREKANFRQSKQWKEFREMIRLRQNNIDPITQSKLSKKAHLHHLDLNPENYGNLDPDKFILLNTNTHKLTHFCYYYYCKFGDKFIYNLEVILRQMKVINYQPETIPTNLFGE